MAHASTRLGRVDIVPLCDGWAPLPLDDECPGRDVNWDVEKERFPWAFAGRASWAWHVHAFLLLAPGASVLIDTGIGRLGRPPYDVKGRIDQELGDAGAELSDVDLVVHTHLHADHAGGACRPDGEPTFPNARHVVHPADWEFFRESDDEDFEGRTTMAGLEDRGMIDLIPEDRPVAPGVRVVHTPGHTPGHRSIVLDDDGATMLFTGDLLHVPPQVGHPDWPSNHDVDPISACRSRETLLRRAHQDGWRVAVSHFGRPFGVVGADGWRSDDADRHSPRADHGGRSS